VLGLFAYMPATGTVLTVGSHILSVKLTPTDTADYASPTATVTLVVSAVPTLKSIAVDRGGNLFITWDADGESGLVEVLAAGGYTTMKTLHTFDAAGGVQGVAVDGSGDLFVVNSVRSAVYEILAAGGYATMKTLSSGLSGPEGIAVDGSANVFVTDYASNTVSGHEWLYNGQDVGQRLQLSLWRYSGRNWEHLRRR
jgi:hypothetical protein